MRQQLLLLKDVHGLGRKGDLVTAKSGYFRNYLSPRQYALLASPHTIKMQEQLQEERRQQALVERQESEKIAEALQEFVLEIAANIDEEGNLYGSITPFDIVKHLRQNGYAIEKHEVITPVIKKEGEHKVVARFKEGVEAHFIVKVVRH